MNWRLNKVKQSMWWLIIKWMHGRDNIFKMMLLLVSVSSCQVTNSFGVSVAYNSTTVSIYFLGICRSGWGLVSLIEWLCFRSWSWSRWAWLLADTFRSALCVFILGPRPSGNSYLWEALLGDGITVPVPFKPFLRRFLSTTKPFSNSQQTLTGCPTI